MSAICLTLLIQLTLTNANMGIITMQNICLKLAFNSQVPLYNESVILCKGDLYNANLCIKS